MFFFWGCRQPVSLWQWKRRLNLFGGWNLQRDFLFGLDDESNALLEGWEVMEVFDGLPRQLELALLLLFRLLELRLDPLLLPMVSGNFSGAIFSILASRSNWGWLAVGVSWLASAAG